MPKYSAKPTAVVDVLVLGDHPAAALAAALLKHKSKLRIVLASLPEAEAEDRLVTVNPALFDLHPLLKGLSRGLATTPVHGLRFLSDKVDTSSEHRVKSAVVHVCRYSAVREQVGKLPIAEEVESLVAGPIQIHGVDEVGVDISVGKHRLNPRALVVAGKLPREAESILGIPDSWEPDVLHRFTSVPCKAGKHFELKSKPCMPMSLDLCGLLCWGWLLPGDGEFQLIVEQPVEIATPGSGRQLLTHWASVLQRHGILGPKFAIPEASVRTFERPLAGALAHEGVANRTLLIGPAGGFYSACGEDIFPGCWSAIFAADVLKKALREPHLQDALNPFRFKWRTTLGDYLRGPQQNLRFLLPLVYRNPAMTERITEAILLSKSVVR